MKHKHEKEYYFNIPKLKHTLFKQTDNPQSTALMMCEYFLYIADKQKSEKFNESLILSMTYLYYAGLSKTMDINELSKQIKTSYNSLTERLAKRKLI